MMKRGSSFMEGGGLGGKSSGLKCKIVLLDGREVQLEINKKTPGQWVFDHVSGKLGVSEREYFGLLYEDEQKCQQWLETTKPIKKQIKKNLSKVFYCVRLYPTNPLDTNELTRIQLYWQLKRDFTSGRLPCLKDTALQLVALMAQVEFGDWTGEALDYNSRLYLKREDIDHEQLEISKKHRHLRGTPESEARVQFLKLISLIDFYGMVFFNVRYEDKIPYMLGMSPFGVALCKKMKIAQSYNWSRVVQVLYRGRRFIIRVCGEWIADKKFQQLNFDVDSSKTCKDLYTTFIEHVNFYTQEADSKKQAFDENGQPGFPRIPLSSSTEELSRQLAKGVNDKEREERLHRSLSLPRRTKNKIDMQSLFQQAPSPTPPPTTNTTISDPVLDAFRSRKLRNRTQSLSPVEGSDGHSTMHSGESEEGPQTGATNASDMETRIGTAMGTGLRQFDAQSVNSHNPMNDSLLDLADDLGNDDDSVDGDQDLIVQEMDSSPSQKRLSSSLPHIAVLGLTHQQPGVSNGNIPSPHTKRIQSVSEDNKQQNRKLLLSWVKEQKKKDQTRINEHAHDESFKHRPLVLKKTSSGGEPSPTLAYKLKSDSSPPMKRPSSSLLPRLPSSGYDLYDVPRPSPFLYRRPHPSAATSVHSVSNIGLRACTPFSENEYDVPRSLIDLRAIESPHIPTAISYKPTFSRTSSSSEHTSQLAMLRDEYPDYDIPRPSIEHYESDYDVPRSLKSLSICTADSKSEGNISFGALDKMMADIDMQVASVTQDTAENDCLSNGGKSSSHRGGSIENKDRGESEEIVQQNEGTSPIQMSAVEHQQEPDELQSVSQSTFTMEKSTSDESEKPGDTSTQSSESGILNGPIKSTQGIVSQHQNTIDESVFTNRVLRPLTHQPASFPQITTPSSATTQPLSIPHQQESAYDRLSARLALEQLKKDGIVSQDMHERKKQLPATATVTIGEEKENSRTASGLNPLNSAPQLPKLEDLLQGASSQSQNILSQRMPFDPNFFARQTALEQTNPSSSKHQDHSTKRQPLTNQFIPNQSSENMLAGPAGQLRQNKELSVATSKSQHSTSSKVEPIYQEINEVASNHQRSWSGSSRHNLSTISRDPPGPLEAGGHKRTYSGGDLLSVKRPLMTGNDMGGVRGKKPEEPSTLDRFQWQSASVRYPMRTRTQPNQRADDEESIPNSPSFYTKNPDASTMPESSSTAQQFFPPDHLTNLDGNSTLGGHTTRVMNWMQSGKFWDSGTTKPGVEGGITAPPPPVTGPTGGISGHPMGPMQLGRSFSMSQSVHSHLSSRASGLPRFDQQQAAGFHMSQQSNNKYKDHLYEDPDHLKLLAASKNITRSDSLSSSSNSLGRLRHLKTAAAANNSVNPPLVPPSSMPYITRELSNSKSGSTMYATDV